MRKKLRNGYIDINNLVTSDTKNKVMSYECTFCSHVRCIGLIDSSESSCSCGKDLNQVSLIVALYETLSSYDFETYVQMEYDATCYFNFLDANYKGILKSLDALISCGNLNTNGVNFGLTYRFDRPMLYYEQYSKLVVGLIEGGIGDRIQVGGSDFLEFRDTSGVDWGLISL